MKMFVFISLTALHSILVKSIRCRYMLPTRSNLSLHSILVKSILNILQSYTTRPRLYIPFWLNLYRVFRLVKAYGNNFTFHSG